MMTTELDTELDLRKYALERALESASDPAAIVLAARDFYDFLSPKPDVTEIAAVEDHDTIAVPVDTSQPYVVRPRHLRPLSPVQKAILKIAIDLYREQGRITGTLIGQHAKYESPAAVNSQIRKICSMGYMRRDGWDVIPILTAEGTPVGPVVQKLPPGIAKGAQTWTNKLGDVGRIVT